MRTAQEIMTPKPKTVLGSDRLEDVMKLFLEQGITSSPVLGSNHLPIGMLSELCLTKAYMLHRSKMTAADKVAHHTDLLDPIIFVEEVAPISEVLKQMVAAPTHRILVKNKSDQIVGIISPKDLMRAMIGQNNPGINLKEKLKESETRLRLALLKVTQIEKHLEVYAQVFHETPYMMHAVNEKGIILMANKRSHDVLGYADSELIGKSIFDLYTKPMHPEAVEGLKKVMETGSHHLTYTSLLKKDGSTIRCDIATSALFDEHKKFISTISVLRPIDSDEMLRILNGIVDDKNGPLNKYLK